MFDVGSRVGQFTRLAIQSDRNAWVHASAVGLFRRARAHSRWRRFVAFCLRRSSVLLDLSALQPTLRVRGARYAGVQTVTLQEVIGSEGRARDFDAGFAPAADRLASRWPSAAYARYLGLSLAPVKLIQIGQAYFVRDGHHRLSVARALGEEAIEAEVIVWEAAGPLPWESPACCPALAAEAA